MLAAMLLVLDKMLRLFDFVVTAGGPVSVVWRMLANLLPEYFCARHPNRVDARNPARLPKARYVVRARRAARRRHGYGRLLRVPYRLCDRPAAAQPVHRRLDPALDPLWLRRPAFELRSGALGASIKVGEFNRLGRRMTLRIDRSEDQGTRLPAFSSRSTTSRAACRATAEQGQFLSTDDPDTIIFRLTQRPPSPGNRPSSQTPRILSFDKHDLPITCPGSIASAGAGHDKLRTDPARAFGAAMADDSQEQRNGCPGAISTSASSKW